MRRWRAAVGLVALQALAGAAQAQMPEPVQGQPLKGQPVLELGGKQVPLAEGVWLRAGDAPGRVVGDAPPGGFGLIRNLVLLRPSADGHRVAAMAEVNVNQIGIEDGWGLAAECSPGAPGRSGIVVRSGWDASCWFIAPRSWDWQGDLPPAWAQARDAAGSLELPVRTITIGLRVANRHDVVDLRFHLAEAADLPPTASLEDWALAALGAAEAGMKHRLPGGLALPAFDTPRTVLAEGGIARERLAQLSDLVVEGTLSRADAERQAAAIRRTAERDGSEAIDPGDISFYRWLTFQSSAAMSDAALTFMWTAQSLQAAAVTLLQTSFRSARGYIGTKVWNYFGTPTTRPDVARVVDFEYGGRAAAE